MAKASSRSAQQSGHRRPDDALTRGLGWASVGLGLPLVLAPRKVMSSLGIGDEPRQQSTAALVGVRELLAAGGLLATKSPVWLWSRVAGDAMDLTLLGRALRDHKSRGNHKGRGRSRTVAATAAVAAITALDLFAASSRSRGRRTTMELTATTTIRTSPQELYEFWRHLDRLPTFMAHVEDVRNAGDGRSHWTVSAPFGRTVEWDAETIEDVPGERISWKSVGSADVDNEGSVGFVPAPGDRGTEISVRISYRLPGGKLGQAAARYFGEDPHQQLDDDLRRLKQVVETGEVMRSDGAPWGKRARKEFPQRPAQPLSDDEAQLSDIGAQPIDKQAKEVQA